MTSQELYSRKKSVFYGWFALAGVMLVVFTVGGVFVNSFGVFLPEISDKMDWSRASLAMALSFGIVAFGLPSPLWGIFVTRFGARFTIIVGNVAAALGIAGLALVQEVWHFYLLYAIIGIGGGFGGYIACSTIATNWFNRKRSLALGLFTACGGLGGFVFPPIATALIESIGWRMTWVVLAGVVMGLGVLIGGIGLIRNKPSDMGQVPDGIPADRFTEIEQEELINQGDTGQTFKQMTQILRRPTIWFIAGFSAANAFAQGTMATHQVAYLQDINFDAMTAASTVSIMAAMSVIGSVTLGALAIKWNVKYLAFTGLICELIALIVLLLTQELGLIYLYAVVFGIGNGAMITAMPTFVAVCYGRQQYARALGIVLPFQVLSQAVAAYLAGLIYDSTSSYTIAFYTIIGGILLGIGFVALVKQPKK